MRILLLGGTVFVGRAFTDAALAAGHQLTHLNRGLSGPGEPRVETLHADRTDAAAISSALGSRNWDAVVDTSGYLPQVVKLTAQALRGRASRYLFVSTISVYSGDTYDEDAPVPAPLDPVPDARTPETYGALKAMCETVVRDAWDDAALIVRPGLIVGPHDPTDRFTYWPVRMDRGGTVLAPGRPRRRVQVIDVRDLAQWMVHLLAIEGRGTFNATGPASPLTMGELLETCVSVSANGAALAWADEAFLLEHKVGPWMELPLWLPEKDNGLMGTPIQRALDAGLRFRPVAETIADTLAWAKSRPSDHAWKAGLDANKEADLLAKLKAKSGSGSIYSK